MRRPCCREVEEERPRSIEDLEQRIGDEVALIDGDQIRNAVSAFYYRVAHCQTVNGDHFEHLLK
jgi:hypothetical protein